MSEYIKYVNYKMNNHPDWKLLENLYEKNYENYLDKSLESIPKLIHQIWIGGKIPDKFKRLSETWIEKNPTWTYRLWGNDDVNDLNLVNKILYDRASNVGIKSDILRYEILYTFGGISVDTDFECIKSFDDLRYLDFFAGNGYSVFPHTYCGLIGIKPKHEILLRLLNNIKKKENQNINISFDEVLKFTGPNFFSEVFFKYLHENINNNDRIVIFPRLFFYSFPPNLRHEVKNLTLNDRQKAYNYIDKDKSYAIHYWNTSWQK